MRELRCWRARVERLRLDASAGGRNAAANPSMSCGAPKSKYQWRGLACACAENDRPRQHQNVAVRHKLHMKARLVKMAEAKARPPALGRRALQRIIRLEEMRNSHCLAVRVMREAFVTGIVWHQKWLCGGAREEASARR